MDKRAPDLTAVLEEQKPVKGATPNILRSLLAIQQAVDMCRRTAFRRSRMRWE